jgi:beta-mannosidase
MQIQSLTGKWQFRQANTSEWLPATVPGGVHTDLLDLGLIPDPFVGDNEKKVMWVAEEDWAYTYTFTPEAAILAEDQIFLVADGLDTLAKVTLNGTVLGNVNNQFRQWEWNVKEILTESENTLEIYFSGPAAAAVAAQKQRQMKGVDAAIEGAPHVRKAPCQFGWDWGPMLPSVGVWKDIRLEAFSVARIEGVHIRQAHKDQGVVVSCEVRVEGVGGEELGAEMKITAPNGDEYFETGEISDGEGSLKIQIVEPQLWWPNGYPSTSLKTGGEQNLYDVAVTLESGDEVLDSKNYKIGLRTIELKQEDDEFGKSFQFVVNGVPIFAKGANWIPADSFITRFSDERLEKLIADAAASHQNMLRVWGGGLYEEERFYDLCDQYGLLVWQDFTFACSIYPLDESEFLENVHIEAEQNMRRLRHRASLALWCGNNEIEQGWESWGWAPHPLEDMIPTMVAQYPEIRPLVEAAGPRNFSPDWETLKNGYDQFFHHLLPVWVAKIDPDTPYWPSSPSSNTPFRDVNSESHGDAHYWDVWHGRKPFSAYRGSYPRFMSEFGFQAFPTMETIEAYAAPEDRNLTSYIMEHHQRGNHGNGLIIAQMTDTFRMPKDFTAWIYLSLILQAEGIRYGVEHWRRNMHRVAGTLYWQLNDCWPVASWASIDYFGRWKALHYAAKRFFAPVLLSVEDKAPLMDVHVTSDLVAEWGGTLKWTLESISGEVVDSGSLDVSANPLADTLVLSFDFSDRINPQNERDLIFICEVWQGEKYISTAVGTFVPSKHLSLTKPNLSVTMRSKNKLIEFTLSPDSLTRFVELKLGGAPETVFSDNYFDIPAERSVTVTCPLPEGWTLAKAEEALKVYSLYDSFA